MPDTKAPHIPHGLFVLGLFVLIALALTGCASQGVVRLSSATSQRAFEARLPTRVFARQDANSIDIYMTDLPIERWHPDTSLAGVSASLVHIHQFIAPKPGETPISNNASNATVRYILIAPTGVGIYAGGGFLRASGDTTLHATLVGSTLNLVHHSAGFSDALGPSTLTATVDATGDDRTIAALQARVQAIVQSLASAP